MKTSFRVAIAAVFLGASAGASLGSYWLGYAQGKQNQSSEAFAPLQQASQASLGANASLPPAAGPPIEFGSVTRSTIPFDQRP